MIHVSFSEPDLAEWQSWKEAADAATQELIRKVAAGEDYRINERLYKRMRQVIFDAFHGKCAYCESKFILDQSGHVEHYRPKKAVTDENDQPVLVASGGAQAPHPGYYWLAYDWHNLLPACEKCNTQVRTRDGKLIGKGTRFPVRGMRAARPGQEAQEQPLFLHPVFDEPERHLLFDGRTGIIGARDERGQACIDLLGLNREGLPEARRTVYTSLLARMHEALSALRFNALEVFLATLKAMNAYKKGEEEYSCAGRKALEDNREQLSGPLTNFLEILGS
jgi:5-methylcytosine-specific restriction endonuclease McrA